MAAPPKKNQVFKDVTLDVAEKALVISYSTDVGNGEFTHHKKKCVNQRLPLPTLPSLPSFPCA